MDNSQQALAQLQQAQASAQDPSSLLAQQQNALGVAGQRDVTQGLRGAISNTTKLLQQVAPSVRGRTQNSLVTNAQATRQIGNEQAPIAQNLNEQNLAYGQAAQDLNDLESRAAQAAQAAYTGQQDRLSYLQNLYNTYYQREQDAAQQAEQKRQFDAQLSRSGGGGGGLDISGLLGALGGSNGYAVSQDKGGGTQFTYQGKPITAAQYAKATGGSLASFLQTDKNSQKAYNDYASGKFTYDQLVKKYPYIFGGV